MLFDLQGKRRRVVQVTYLGLALLMGGGLVFFGIGGDVSGGLFDAFSDNRGGGNGNSLVEDRIDKNEDRVKANPKNQAARKELVRDYFQLAAAQVSDQQGTYPDESKDELRKASANWKAYLALDPKRPDTSLARVALQIYDPTALNKPKDGMEVARIIAENDESAASYLGLVQYATLAGDTRVADLAGQKAVDLAPEGERAAVKAQIKQIKQAQTQSQGTAPQG